MKKAVQSGKIKSSCALGLVLAMFCGASSFAAQFPAPVDGVVTLSVADGSVTTYDTGTLSSQVTKVIKTGKGQAIIAVESPLFTGTTEVQGGTLTLKVHQALGPVGISAIGGDITVADKATLHLNWPGIAQGTYLWTKRTVTIEGTGADGQGAIRIQPTAGAENPMNDSTFGTIALSGDATVTSTQRWGFSVAFRFNTHTLTRNGAGSMMFIGKFYGPGNIVLNSEVKKTPTNVASFQENVSFDGFTDGTSTVTCNAGARVSLYKVKNPIPFNFVFASSNGYVYASNNGTAPNENRNLNVITGDITFPSPEALSGTGKVFTFQQDKNSSVNKTYMTWKGTVTQPVGTLLNHVGSGSLVLDGRFEGGAANGDSANRFQFTNGELIFGPNADVCNLYPANFSTGKGQMLFEGGKVHLTGPGLGAYGGGTKAKPSRQIGGSVHVACDSTLSAGDNTYGSFYIEGGDVTFSNFLYVSATKDLSNGFLVQRGGLIRSPIQGQLQYYGYKGHTVYYQCGGTNDSCCTGRGAERVKVNMSNGSALMAITGSNTLFKTEWFLYACGDDGASYFNLSLSDGATLSLDCFRRKKLDSEETYAHPAYVYGDGGVLHIRKSNGLTNMEGSDPNFYRANPTHFVIGPKGLTFDTTDCIQQVGPPPSYYKSYIPFTLEKPTGRGVSKITLPTTDAFKALTYYSPMRIEIEGDGFGAAAFADWDFETSSLVVRITNPGCGYTKDKTTVKIASPDLSAWYDCDFELSEFTCGPLVVKGQGIMLYNAASTFDGGLVIEKGAYVRMYNPGAVPAGNALTVYGEFNVNTNNLTVSSVAGNGRITCDGTGAGNIVLAANGTVHLKAADLFAAGSTALRFPRRFTMSNGAKIVLDDPENLPEESAERKPFLTAGTLELVDGTVPQLEGDLGAKWRVRLSDGGKTLCLGQKKGLCILFR